MFHMLKAIATSVLFSLLLSGCVIPCETSLDRAMFGLACLPLYGSGPSYENDNEYLYESRYPNGKIQEKGKLDRRSGVKIGVWSKWDEDGKLIDQQDYGQPQTVQPSQK